MKDHRQIIMVSHNPNIPVLGDAEGVVIFERNKNGKVDFRNGKKAGCIEEKLIRCGICEIMEGGEEWICQEKCSRINSQNFFDGYAARG